MQFTGGGASFALRTGGSALWTSRESTLQARETDCWRRRQQQFWI